MNTGNDYENPNGKVFKFERTLKDVFLSNIIRTSGRITVPKNKITTLVLEDPDRLCGEDAKEDTEAMFIDPIYNVGYIIQKVRPRNEIKTPVIFKVIKFTIDISILRYNNRPQIQFHIISLHLLYSSTYLYGSLARKC